MDRIKTIQRAQWAMDRGDIDGLLQHVGNVDEEYDLDNVIDFNRYQKDKH